MTMYKCSELKSHRKIYTSDEKSKAFREDRTSWCLITPCGCCAAPNTTICHIATMEKIEPDCSSCEHRFRCLTGYYSETSD